MELIKDVEEKKGIIFVAMRDGLSEENIVEIIDKTKEKLKEFKGKGRTLVEMGSLLGEPLFTYDFRKKLVEKAKEIVKEIGFEKVAVFGLTTIPRTFALFIINTIGAKGIRIFSDRDEALKWLKET